MEGAAERKRKLKREAERGQGWRERGGGNRGAEGGGSRGRGADLDAILLIKLVNGKEHSLGIEGGEDGLHKEEITAALHERVHLRVPRIGEILAIFQDCGNKFPEIFQIMVLQFQNKT